MSVFNPTQSNCTRDFYRPAGAHPSSIGLDLFPCNAVAVLPRDAHLGHTTQFGTNRDSFLASSADGR
jgi:hypothetical protein